MSNKLPIAYSRLPDVLQKCQLQVQGLHRKLREIGLNVNPKSLYRLTTSDPVQKIDTRILAGICKTCDVKIQDVIVFEKPHPTLMKLNDSEQKRLNQLMSRNNEEKLSSKEASELNVLTEKAHQLTMHNARTLVAQRVLNRSRVSRVPRPKKSRKPAQMKVRSKPQVQFH